MEDEWLRFELKEKKPKTNIYSVISKCSNCELGVIKWHPSWRHYCFFPTVEFETVHSDRCLLSISQEVARLNQEHQDYHKCNADGSAMSILRQDSEKIREAADSPLIREQLAELEHNQWWEWSKNIAVELEEIEQLINDEADMGDIDKARDKIVYRLKRWKSLWIPYVELTEEFKDDDRKWADKVLALIKFRHPLEHCGKCGKMNMYCECKYGKRQI